jgi:hypothetical protein
MSSFLSFYSLSPQLYQAMAWKVEEGKYAKSTKKIHHHRSADENNPVRCVDQKILAETLSR